MSNIISIIVPVYNVEKYIHRCIESILNQTYKNFELILVDDGSLDNSGVICDEYAKKDDRILVIHKENGGVSTARNAGIDVAQGQYIMFVDSDDFLEHNCLDVMTKATEEGQVDLVVGGYKTISFRGLKRTKRINEYMLGANKFNKQLFMNMLSTMIFNMTGMVFLTPWAKLYKADIIKEHQIRFSEGIGYGEDTIFCIDFYNRIQEIAIINACVYNYDRSIEGTASKKGHDNFGEMSMVLTEKYIELFEGPKWEECLRRIVSTRVVAIIFHYADGFKFKKAASKIKETYLEFNKKYDDMIDLNIVNKELGFGYKGIIENQNWAAFIMLWKIRNIKKKIKKEIKNMFLRMGLINC